MEEVDGRGSTTGTRYEEILLITFGRFQESTRVMIYILGLTYHRCDRG